MNQEEKHWILYRLIHAQSNLAGLIAGINDGNFDENANDASTFSLSNHYLPMVTKPIDEVRDFLSEKLRDSSP